MRRLAALGLGLLAVGGCKLPTEKPAPPNQKYQVHPPDASLPAYLHGTVKDLTIVGNTGDFPVSSYGLITGLRGTGDSTAPTIVREWMTKEMVRHGLGRESMGYSNISPETMLADPRVSIVGVVANVPAGARRGDRVDVAVQVMPGNNTTSLANGMLWRASLRINGMADPTGAVNEYAKAQGNLFVNPAYAVHGSSVPGGALASLRAGTIPYGGIVTTDRPIHLVLRSPSWATSQAIEHRLDQEFQAIADVP
jgi:flagellar P-ring protein precursor FlgI